MRIIEKKMAAAWAGGYDFSLSNTVVKSGGVIWDYDTNKWLPVAVAVYLHGNLIAYRDNEGRAFFSCGGWHTVTTASRLRALGAAVHIKQGRIVKDSDNSEIRFSFVRRSGYGC